MRTDLPPRRARPGGRRAAGITLVELLVGVAIAGLLLAGLAGVVSGALDAERAARSRHDRVRDGRLALERMVRAVGRSPRLLIPTADRPATAGDESVRDVLAVVLDPEVDRDADGVADADNDGDGLVDEDVGFDANADGAAGIAGIDDDGDGLVDETNVEDDDEDEEAFGKDEDPENGVDDDGDGLVDEDAGGDRNGDLAAGVLGADDDGDGQTDESNVEDDDEDEDETGNKDEDWLDTVTFHVVAGTLVERTPVPGAPDGTVWAEVPLAGPVARFEVERLPRTFADRATVVRITLELGVGADTTTLETRVRVGGAL